jgi:hypothetical protein
MLAQNFLSPAELRLSDKQHAALVLALGAMERGELEYVNEYEEFFYMSDNRSKSPPKFFNIMYWNHYIRARAGCGTIACIGGTAELLGHCRFDSAAVGRNPQLNDLFYPPFDTGITVPMAARALRSYLTTGNAHWEEVYGVPAAQNEKARVETGIVEVTGGDIEVVIARDRVWINVDGVCRFRTGRAKVQVDDRRRNDLPPGVHQR